MKALIITLSITFLAAMSAFGQSITVSPSILTLRSTSGASVAISAFRSENGGLPVLNNRQLLTIQATGESGATSNFPTAKINFNADENFTATSRATSISFDITKPNTIIPQLAMTLSSKGFLAVGNLTPNARLQLENGYVNRKIVLHEVANNDHAVTGFGVMDGLRYQIPNTTEAHIFYAGASAGSSNELMRIQGNGNVGIGTMSPTDAKLHIASGGNALHVEGGIKVSGSSPAALRLEANTDVFSMLIPTTSANAQTDLLFVTRATGTGGGTGTAYYAKWDGAVWEIRREDNGTITAGTNINVLVIKQ
jgi:hypothetical protein